MAIEKRGTKYRAYWRNPHTKEIEHGPTRATKQEAVFDSDDAKLRLKHKPWTFAQETHQQTSRAEVVLFRDAARAYLARPDLAPTTIRTTFSALLPAVQTLGKVPAMDLTRHDLRRYEAQLVALGSLTQSTIHRKVKLVSIVLGWARSTGLIEHHQVEGHTIKKGSPKQDPPPTPDEVRKLINAAPPHLRRAIILTYHLGLRFGPSEVQAVRWEDFDAQAHTLTVRCIKNKQRPWRKVLIQPAVMQEMLSWLAEDTKHDYESIVHWAGKPVTSTMIGAWNSTLQRAGITRHMTPYDLRHTFATEALASGADMKAVAMCMGHQDVSMLHKHYQYVLNSQIQAVSASIPDVLGIQNGDTVEPVMPIFSYPTELNLKQ